MNLLEWLKLTALSEWLSTSLLGVPTLMALHSIGMAAAVGLSLMITLSLYRRFIRFRAELVPGFLRIAIWGFVFNFLTGVGIFITRGPEYITTVLFDVKLVLVFVSAGGLIALRDHLLRTDSGDGTIIVDGRARAISLISTTALFAAVIAGRLLAYLSSLY